MKALANVREVIVRFGSTAWESEILFDGEKQMDILEIRIKRIAPDHGAEGTASPGTYNQGVFVEERTLQAGG